MAFIDRLDFLYMIDTYGVRMSIDWTRIVGFEWDSGNALKSEQKHGVRTDEAEEVCLNQPLLVLEDPAHSSVREPRWRALGQTGSGRLLQIAFTVRNDRLRVISGRPMSRKERLVYEEAIQTEK